LDSYFDGIIQSIEFLFAGKVQHLSNFA